MVQQDRPPFVPPLIPFKLASVPAGQIPNSFTFSPPGFLPHFRNSQQLILDTDSPPSHENGTPNERGPLHERKKCNYVLYYRFSPSACKRPRILFFPGRGKGGCLLEVCSPPARGNQWGATCFRSRLSLVSRGLQSVRLLRPPPLFLSDYRTRRGIEKSANGHSIPRLDINQEILRKRIGLQATNRLHFSPN